MFTIPNNLIPKQNNYVDKAGDIVESFSIDLNREYGSFIPNKMRLLQTSDDDADLALAVGFTYTDSQYFLATTNVMFNSAGGDQLTAGFTESLETSDPNGELGPAVTDLAVFNGYLYVSGDNEIMKRDPASNNWSTPVTTQLTAGTPHLLAVLGTGGGVSRLYVTDDYSQVHSVSTADAIAATGSYTMNLGLSSEWTITMLETGSDLLWIGCLNTETGAGYMFSWDGATENTPQQAIPLASGVAAGTVLDGTPYILDIRGRLMRYAGNSFVEVERFNLKTSYVMDGAGSKTNLRFIHPNGMTTTDKGTVLMFVSNETAINNVHEEFATGIYEYDPQVGLYHKYALATNSDRGFSHIAAPGALFFSRSTSPTTNGNGTLICSAQYYTNASTTKYGLFINDSAETVQGYGYFITPKFFSSSIEDSWNKVTTIHDRLSEATDKIVVKYRTREKISVSAVCNWLNDTEFTTTGDVSDFEIGDEVTITRGVGAGQSMHIVHILSSSTVTTITVDENPLGSTGSFYGLFRNFKKFGTVTNTDSQQWHDHTILDDKTSPWAQFKVELYLTKKRLHKLVVDNKTNK